MATEPISAHRPATPSQGSGERGACTSARPTTTSNRRSGVGEVIRDLRELRRHGQVRRRVPDLHLPIEVWRSNVRLFARREGFRVRTGLVELLELSDPVTRQVRTVPVIYAVRLRCPDTPGHGISWRPSRWDPPPTVDDRPGRPPS